MTYLLAYITPAIIILISIPMVLGKVPPNKLYGFRTAKTLSARDIWYPANRASGWFMIIAGVVAMAFNSAILLLPADWPEETLVTWLTIFTVAPLLLSLVASLLYLRRL